MRSLTAVKNTHGAEGGYRDHTDKVTQVFVGDRLTLNGARTGNCALCRRGAGSSQICFGFSWAAPLPSVGAALVEVGDDRFHRSVLETLEGNATPCVTPYDFRPVPETRLLFLLAPDGEGTGERVHGLANAAALLQVSRLRRARQSRFTAQ